MTVSDAIARADELRVNLLGEEIKAGWIHSVEQIVADMMGEKSSLTGNYSKDRNVELLMPAPHDNIYVKYLAAMISYYSGDDAGYANDIELYNKSFAESSSWWIRNHRPASHGIWRT